MGDSAQLAIVGKPIPARFLKVSRIQGSGVPYVNRHVGAFPCRNHYEINSGCFFLPTYFKVQGIGTFLFESDEFWKYMGSSVN